MSVKFNFVVVEFDAFFSVSVFIAFLSFGPQLNKFCFGSYRWRTIVVMHRQWKSKL